MKHFIQNHCLALGLTLGLGVFNPIFASNQIETEYNIDELKNMREQISSNSFQKIARVHSHFRTCALHLTTDDREYGRFVIAQTFYKLMCYQLENAEPQTQQTLSSLIPRLMPARGPMIQSTIANLPYVEALDFPGEASNFEKLAQTNHQHLQLLNQQHAIDLSECKKVFNKGVFLTTLRRDVALFARNIFIHHSADETYKIASLATYFEVVDRFKKMSAGTIPENFQFTKNEQDAFQSNACDAAEIIQWLMTDAEEIKTYRTIVHDDRNLQKHTQNTHRLLNGGIDKMIDEYERSVRIPQAAHQFLGAVQNLVDGLERQVSILKISKDADSGQVKTESQNEVIH